MTSKKLLTLSVSMAALLSACTMTPAYERPDYVASQAWNTEADTLPLLSEKGVPDIHWQSFFQSEEMQKVIQTALDNNRDLRLAVLNVEAARATHRITRADVMPNLNANASGSIQETSDRLTVPGADKRTEVYQANLGIASYELDLFGRVRSLSRAALEEYLGTVEAQNAARIALIAETANAYLQLLADRKLLQLTVDTLDAQGRSYELVRKSYDNGVGSRLDVARASTAVETARVNLANYKRLIKQDENILALLMGVANVSEVLPQLSLDDVNILQELPVGVPSDVLLLRPDIRQAEHKLKAANANIGAARAAFFPRITLTGTYGFGSDELDRLFTGGASDMWSFLPQITLPIFNGGRNKANLELAEIRKDIAITSYEKALQVAFREVSDQLAARETLSEEYVAQRALVDATKTVYDVSYARYKTGIDNFLSVLDAQRSQFAAEQGLIELEKQRFTNLVTLYKVLGGGVKSQLFHGNEERGDKG